MKNSIVQKITSIPLAIITAISATSLLLIWTLQLTTLVDITSFSNGSPSGFWLIGFVVGYLMTLKSSKRRLEFGGVFFALVGSGISLLIIRQDGAFLRGATFLFGFYTAWQLAISIVWLMKNTAMNFLKGAIILGTSFGLVLGLMWLANSYSSLLLLAGIGALLMAALTLFLIPGQMARYLVVSVSRIFFRLNISHSNNIPLQGGALVVSNHVSFMDFVILTSAIQRNIRFVMHQDVFDKPLLRPILKKLNMIPIAPRGGKNNFDNFNAMCQTEINNGHVVVIFAEGTITRNGQLLPFKRGVEHIAKGIDSPIIPIHLEGVLGTPFTYTYKQPKAITPSINNVYKKIFVTVGSPLPATTSVFSVRQVIHELGAKSFHQNINKKETLGKRILSIDRKKELLQDVDGQWMKGNSIIDKSLLLALRLRKSLRDDKKVGLVHANNINFNLIVYALAILGKEVVVLDPSCSVNENKLILKRLQVSVCINGIGKVKNPCKRFINAFGLMKKATLHEAIYSFIYKIIPARLTLLLMNNTQSKYSHVFTLAKTQEKQVKGISMTNNMMLTKSEALKQIHLTKDYGTVLSLHSLYSNLGFFIDILMPITLGIKHTKKDFSVSNTVIGLVKDIEQNITKIKANPSITRILMDSDPISEYLQKSLGNIKYFQGFGAANLSPIIAVNTPDYSGKDIVGIPLIQQGNQPESVGRPIPSIAVKIVKDAVEVGINEWGKIWIKGASMSKKFIIDSCGNKINEYIDWVDTQIIGMIDDKGFLSVAR